ncbi:protein polybromo-1 isoform X3 [Bacillus rossius redtenbacheri]|uniref:protein polybromo-1 isoform X3 n=1 Tax=Bacillus rossius redtenbacheri TaxID=93214 RepID=UPI002FDE9F32
MSAGTSWIQRLSKAALTRLLTEAGEAVSETEKIEVLRTRIRKLARKSPGDFDVSPGRLELLGEMNKRRRTSSVASRQEEDADTDSVPEPARKKKKLDPSELCQQLYDTIRNYKKDDGTLLCDSFIRAPKRRQEPAYYEVVSNPIDMLKVQQKLKTDEYEDIEDLATDIQLICNNAKAFYKRTSQEYRDACELWELFVANKNRLVDSEESGAEHKGKIILKVGKLARRAAAAAEARKQDSEATEGENSESSSNNPDDDMNQYEELFTAVMLATDSDNRPLHTVFQLLPSKKRYPEYYDVIENPIDLKMIATKIQQNKYTSINDMEKDLLQMTKNACQFNEPGSQIYKDAKALRKVITGKKTEVEHGKLEHGKFVPGKTSERISGPSRNKRLRGVQSLSAITAALRDEDEDSDEGEMDEEPEIEDADNPRWQLFESVKNASSPAGHILSEPFWKLPSKRYYPDYYKEIKNPVSLSQIKKKLKRGDYGTVSEVAGDMNIMFENAKKYNRPDSRLYKDAVKLQKLMQTKVHEILDLEQDSDSDGDSDDRSRKRSRGKFSVTPKVLRYKDDLPLKKRLHALGKCLLEYVHEDGRQPILMFMEKPSKKLYPDYFQVITEPIDMLTIQANINAEKYNSEEEIISDFKLMFNNCRQYNEEGSMIYEDANKLEHVLMEKLKELGPLNDLNKKGKGPVKVRKSTSAQAQKLKTLYDTIKDYKDPKGRQLSLIFQKLPSKIEYPDYYEVIKRPIDLERISQKLKTSQYETLDDIVSDFVLMFDNACKYNEPDSQIYKRVALQTKLQLREDEESVPDVTAAVQELLTSLFIAIYNHQDEEGRCFSDSMAELPEHDEVDGQKVRALSLDLIKRRLDRGLYRRLDTFQEDVFACLERARRLSRTDSQVFEDSIELQSCFIRQRDELCRGGDLLHSPALNYTLLDMAEAVEATRQHKLLEEQPEEEAETRSSDDSLKVSPASPPPARSLAESGASAGGDSMSFNQQVYRVGDFVYVEPKERGMESSIIHIERLWTNQEGQQMMYGNVLFRPNETYHVTTRKFLEKEVFKSDVHKATPLNQLLGVCCVMSVKDYFRSIPEGFAEKDVYVCESRYSTRARAFKKIKVWPFITTQNLKLIPREEVLEPKRIMSVYRERVEKHKEEIAELEEREKFVVKEKPNIEVFYPQGVEGHTYFEQYNTPACLIRTGDCVYVRTDGGRQFVAQVDTIWTTKNGVCYFRGPWLVTPPEIPHAPTRLFYKQEVFLSTLEDTNPVENIAGKCAVLEHGEYISCGGQLPCVKTLRETYVPKIQEAAEEQWIKSIEGQDIVILCDETTDKKGQCVFVVLFKTLQASDSQILLVAGVKILENSNASECSRAILEVLTKFKVDHTRVVAVVCDSARYMTKCVHSLQVVLSSEGRDVLHVQCWSHKLNLIQNIWPQSLPELNNFVSKTKTAFMNTRKRKHKYLCFLKQRYPEQEKPHVLFPSPVLTRWGSWFESVGYVNTYLDDLVTYLKSLELESSEALMYFQTLSVEEIVIIQCQAEFLVKHGCALVELTKQLEGSSYPMSHLISGKLSDLLKSLQLVNDFNFGSKTNESLKLLAAVKQGLVKSQFQSCGLRCHTKLMKLINEDLSKNIFQNLGQLFNPREIMLNDVCNDMVRAGKSLPFVSTVSGKEFLEGYSALKEIVVEKVKKSEGSVDIIPILLALKLDHSAFAFNALKAIWIPVSNVDSERTFSAYSDVFSDKRRSLKPQNVELMVSLYFGSKT